MHFGHYCSGTDGKTASLLRTVFSTDKILMSAGGGGLYSNGLVFFFPVFVPLYHNSAHKYKYSIKDKEFNI